MSKPPEGQHRKDVERARQFHAEASLSGRDISRDYPSAGDLDRRNACEWDLKRFCEAYFPQAFSLAWSDDHVRVIGQIQSAIIKGGLFALAMPRASGKTTISIKAALWALLYGHRRFVCLVGSTERHASEILKQIKSDLSLNDELYRDHRQVLHAVRKLENQPRRCQGQLWGTKPTRIEWCEDHITFGTVPDSACDGYNVSGSTVSVAGLTGALRGQSHALADGTIIRPELVILDDPQTRESAMSPSQSETRRAIIHGDVLGMGGPDQKITAIMPCTVIRTGDLADTMLDRKKSPRWKGDKCKLIYKLPDDEKLWGRYKELRDDSFARGGNGSEATAFYSANRAAMDSGSQPAWISRHNEDELSATQHAMNLKLDDERAFWAEYQNEPLPEENANPDDLTADQIAAKVNRQPRGAVPLSASRLTAMIDVQGSLLYYVVAAWEDDFTGYVIDYGTWPDQKVGYFLMRDAKHTLSKRFPHAGLEGQIYVGLETIVGELLSRDWLREDGSQLKIERCLIDANWGTTTAVVKKYCRESAYSGVITPSHGKFIGAGTKPMWEWHRSQGDRIGLNWKMPVGHGRKEVRSVIFDTNFWKSFVHTRLAVAMGDRGCLSIFGQKSDEHRCFADHLSAEYRVKTEGRGRSCDEWKNRPERPDNHWFDCIVGCAVAASIQGITLAASAPSKSTNEPRRVSFASLQKRTRA